MTIKRHHQGHGVMLPRVRNCLTDDLLVPQMHAVKYTNGQADPAAAMAQFVRGVNKLHRRKSTNPQPSNSREIPKTKHKAAPNPRLKFGACCFSGAWTLEVGSFMPPPVSKTE